MSASPDVLLGPSSGAVEFTVGGSDAFAFVPSKVLGIANVTRVGVSGQASLTLGEEPGWHHAASGWAFCALCCSMHAGPLDHLHCMSDNIHAWLINKVV